MLPVDLSVLQQPVLHWTCLFSAACAEFGRACPTQQPMLSLDVSVLLHLLLPMDMWHLCCTVYCAALDVSVLQQPVLPQDVSLLQLCCPLICLFNSRLDVSLCLFYNSLYVLCITWMYLFNISLCCARCAGLPVYNILYCIYVSLQELLLHLDVSVFMILCCTCACLSTRALCCTRTCISTVQEPVLLLCVSVYNNFVLHLE
jgi:hypothetical protein